MSPEGQINFDPLRVIPVKTIQKWYLLAYSANIFATKFCNVVSNMSSYDDMEIVFNQRTKLVLDNIAPVKMKVLSGNCESSFFYCRYIFK